jgi:two-component system NarL family response regulator
MKVLLADDNHLLLEGLQNLLEAHGFTIGGMAKDGLEAVALARKLKPDIILMDIRMPVCGGLTATRLIKAEMPETKIIILTTSTEDKDLFEAVKSGACGYLVKSMDADELIEALEQAEQDISPFSPGLAAKILAEFSRLAGQEKETSPISPPKQTGASPDNRLTERQTEVLALVAQGLSYKEAGARLKLSPNTIKYHMTEIMQQLHLQNRAQVLTYAARLGPRGDKPTK